MRTERQTQIRELLTLEGDLRVEELAQRLKVTSMTIRRDLKELEDQGLLLRTHGGCRIQAPMVRELSFHEKDGLQASAKNAIARAVAERLTAGMSVFLDTGTTMVHVARSLPRNLPLRIFTNNLRVAMELFGAEAIETNVLGGRLAAKSPDLVGEAGIANVQMLRVDLAIVGADAVDSGTGDFYSADMPTALFSRAAQGRAERCFLVADSTKFGKRGLAQAGRLADSMTLFTDDGIGAADRKSLKALDIEMVLATT